MTRRERGVPPRDLHASDVGKHDIQNDQIWFLFEADFPSLFATANLRDDRKSGIRIDDLGNHLPNGSLVFYNDDRFHRR